MGLAEFQRALAQLYTDQDFRERFGANPGSMGFEAGLTPAEIQQLTAVSQEQLAFFAQSLRHKRFRAICSLLPGTYQNLPDFQAHFETFAPRFLPSGTQKHLWDALEFGRYLRQKARALPARLREGLLYEEICVFTRLNRPGIRLLLLHGRPWNPGSPDDTRDKLMLCLWVRLRPHQPCWHLRVPWPFLLR